MTEERQVQPLLRQSSEANQLSTKRGIPVYRTNPSVPPSNGMSTRTKRFHVPGGKASVIVDQTSGEIKGIGGMGFWWEEEVDTSRFVKLFLDGIKQAADLSKTGMQVFELVYHEMRANPGSDEIKLNQYVAKDHGISDRTYQRGVRELLEKHFLFRSPSDGVFFVNIRFMFNGDRLAFVRSYHLKGADRQRELAFPEEPILSVPMQPPLLSPTPTLAHGPLSDESPLSQAASNGGMIAPLGEIDERSKGQESESI
jgi:hypothetical protein